MKSNDELPTELLELVYGGVCDQTGTGGGTHKGDGPGDGLGWLRHAIKTVEAVISTIF